MIIVGILLAIILCIIVVGVWRGVRSPTERPPGPGNTLPRDLP
jgi:hypothetical protein